MKQLIILVAATLVFALTEMGKNNTSRQTTQIGSTESKTTTVTTNQGAPANDGSNKAPTRLTGCLTKNDKGKGFMLVSRDDTVEVQSSKDLSDHVGRQVKLEGEWDKSNAGGSERGTKASAAGAKEGGTKGGKEGGTKGRVFKASKVEDVSDACPAPKQ
jgi:hypothetical protein